MRQELGTLDSVLNGAEALLKHVSSSPRLDAELLLASVLKQPRTSVLAHRTDLAPAKTLRRFTNLVRRRTEGVPLPYLTGEKEFYGRPFFVSPAVLIPRPETEDIVEEVLSILGERGMASGAWTIADIGTGSGVLAVTLAANAARVRLVATDSSASALSVARRNARRHKVFRRITFIESDLLTEIPSELAPHLIVANLPYVPSAELQGAGDQQETRGLTFEPQRALDGGPDGLHVIRRFFAQLRRLADTRHPIPDTLRHLILEHSPRQRREIVELAQRTLTGFRPREVSPYTTSWRKRQ